MIHIKCVKKVCYGNILERVVKKLFLKRVKQVLAKMMGAARNLLGCSKKHPSSFCTVYVGLFLPTPPYLLAPPHTKSENTVLFFFVSPHT